MYNNTNNKLNVCIIIYYEFYKEMYINYKLYFKYIIYIIVLFDIFIMQS